ncbi:uncharacterized protein EI97DRAFT_457419 [Westerdykella ornata]|uniref:Uncharacterized protein n=1 Tax=Westerdykella ornata TaxID=318751 RepID=A0A6A6JMD6_WESOR|nr:uncharacterized protein EI97DRAFT_457419 [Westerdykella ornata]KAF2277394.1 hypothetical protein EI97DRAFT_457419 [Westerdykella ornata]
MPIHPINVPIRTPADILHRSSRPQYHSTYLPPKRDWRYVTGVYRHEDFTDTPGDQTVWDMLDEDACGARRKRRRKERKRRKGWTVDTTQAGNKVEEGEGNGVGYAATAHEGGEDEYGTSTTVMGRMISRPISIKCFAPISQNSNTTSATNNEYEPTALIVHLRLPKPSANKSRLPDRQTTPAPQTAPRATEVPSTTDSPSSIKTFRTRTSSTTSAVIFSPSPASNTDGFTPLTILSPTPPPPPSKTHNHTSPYKRPWMDNTYAPSPSSHTIRHASTRNPHRPLPAHWTLFPSAVPIDALVPPGIRLSAPELLAFYPNHVLWDGVARRLAGNGYTSEDLTGMIDFFHPAVKHEKDGEALQRFLKHYRTLEREVSKGKIKATSDLRTEALSTSPLPPTATLTPPKFTALTSSLANLPTGLAARDFTVAIRWWLTHRNAFTPPLEFNVLHARPLIQALRIPVKSVGRRNLDKVILEEWRVKGGTFEECATGGTAQEGDSGSNDEKTGQGSCEAGGGKGNRLEIDVNKRIVRRQVEVKLRHVLTFPFLALLSLAGDALELGIEKAEARKAMRDSKKFRTLEVQQRNDEYGGAVAHDEHMTESGKKRPKEIEKGAEESPAKKAAIKLKTAFSSLGQAFDDKRS